MCLPVCCLKKLVQLEGWIILLLSILSLVAAIIVTLIEKGIISAIHDLGYEDVGSFGIAVAFWIFTAVVFGLALCGIIGARKRSKCLLAIFNMGNICVFLAFLSLAIVAYALGSAFDLPTCDATGASSIEYLYKAGESQLCQKDCECYFVGNITAVGSAVKNYKSDDSKLPTQFQECSAFPKDDNAYNLQAKSLSYIEEKLDCSGWCTPYPIQIFYDVNSPVKNYNNTCYQAIIDYGKSIGYSVGNVLISIAGVLGLFVLFTCCLCCHPESKNKGTDYYSRMAYYDE